MLIRDNKGKFVKGHKSIVKGGKRPSFHGNVGSFKKGHVPHNKGLGIYKNCEFCGEVIWIENNQIGRKKYCSRACLYKGKSKNGCFQKGHKDLVPVESRKEQGKKMLGHKFNLNKFFGENNWNWKGGVSKIDKLCRRMPEYRQWRSDVFVRDNWICRTCGFRGGYVTAHHIKSFSKLIKENNIKDILEARNCKELWVVDNGVTLCEQCHSLTDNYKGRAK